MRPPLTDTRSRCGRRTTTRGRVFAIARRHVTRRGRRTAPRAAAIRCPRALPEADHVTFTPRLELIVVGTPMPVLRTVDAAIRRRLCTVPFCHPTGRARPDAGGAAAGGMAGDPALDDRGRTRLALRGCARRPRRPAAVTAAASLGSQDIVGQVLGEWCEMGEKHLETAAQLYAAWCVYALNVGEAPGTQRRFAARLDRHGLIRERLRYARVCRGVRLRFRGEMESDVHKAKREALCSGSGRRRASHTAGATL